MHSCDFLAREASQSKVVIRAKYVKRGWNLAKRAASTNQNSDGCQVADEAILPLMNDMRSIS